MVKRAAKTSISEDDEQSQILNGNGKRTVEESNKEVKKRLKTKSLYRQPTANELNRLQETETIFNSNLFRLQVEEILQEVNIKEKTEKRFQQWFIDFKNHLLTIPNDDTEYDLTEYTLTKKLKVKLPISKKLNKTKCVFKFHKFSNVTLVGSYSLGCAINSKLRVDIQITVPAETYTKNDSINYRYHKKRAAYLAFIASHIKGVECVQNVQYTWLGGCETKPVLDVTPSGKLNKYLSVRIDLVCETEAYKLHRFSPVRNNLRESWLFNEESSGNNSDIGFPTPYYNNSVLRDLTASQNEDFLKEVLLKSENLKQAIVLLKIWLRQRNLQVSGFIVSMLVAYLVQLKRINNIMSSYQIARNVWIALKSSDWDVKGISLYKGEDTPSIEEFDKHFPVVFLDKTGYYNICWQMSKGTYQALRRESSLAIDMLDNSKINSFIPLYMVPVQPLLQFDHILRFKNLQKLKDSVIAKAPSSTKLNFGVDESALVLDSLHSILVKGLGDRVDLIMGLEDADLSWPVTSKPEKAVKESSSQLSFGFIYNSENCMKIVEKGPPANFPEAEQFRLFWGDKSELRRFQDGSITEAVVWEGDSLSERRGINKQIIDYLLMLKYDMKPSELVHACSQLEPLLRGRQYCCGAEEASLRVLRAFDSLRARLRQLTQLPLDVSAVYGVSPVFSYCEPMPALPRQEKKPWRRGDASLVKEVIRDDGTYALPEYTPVNKAIVELGHSGKWPGDIEAFRCLKAAFNVQIAGRLRAQHALPAHARRTHLDVLQDGLVFRLQLAHPKEITLLKKELRGGVATYTDTDESVRLQRDTILLPRLTGALHGLHQKHPSFGPSACLFNRWLCAHLLSPPHFPAALASLLAAAAFVRAAPLAPAATPAPAFMRTLHLLANTDWTTEMLVLDFNDDMKQEEITELERKFAAMEQKPAMYIVTSYDGDLPSVWSADAPSPPVLARARALAASTLEYMRAGLAGQGRHDVLAAFVPSLVGYDVLIYLHTSLVPYSSERVDRPAMLKELPEVHDAEVIPVVEFHPVRQYLEELRSAYSEFALFFHDSYGGEVIAVLWKPDVAGYKEFQVSNANGLKPVLSENKIKYKVNTEALVEDFRLLGQGLVREVVVK